MKEYYKYFFYKIQLNLSWGEPTHYTITDDCVIELPTSMKKHPYHVHVTDIIYKVTIHVVNT